MWSQGGVPHKGWTCVGVEDFESPSEFCEMCPNQEIRYGHFMRHPNYHRDVLVGCVCAENMEGDYTAPRRRESSLKNVAARRRRWLTRTWRTSRKGNDYLNTDGLIVSVFQTQQGAWKASVLDKSLQRSTFTPRAYATQNEAKIAGFDTMIFVKSEWSWGR